MANLKYDEKTFPVKVAEYAAKGDTDARIAARLGIALSTFYTYKEQFPEFAEGLVAGRRICYSRVRAILLKVARGQCKLTTKVFKNGELYKTTERNLPPNLKAIIYFQKHMRVGGRLSDLSCWPHGQKTESVLPQDDSKMLAVRLVPQSGDPTSPTSPTSPTERQCAPAQADSGISKLEERTEQTSPTDQSTVRLVPQSGEPAKPPCAPAQADSGISTLK